MSLKEKYLVQVHSSDKGISFAKHLVNMELNNTKNHALCSDAFQNFICSEIALGVLVIK